MQKSTLYPEVYTVSEFAKIFKMTEEAVRHLIRTGEIPAIRIGRQYRIPETVVKQFFAKASAPEERGFGIWRKSPVDSLDYVNQQRNKDTRSSNEFIEDLTEEEE